MWKASTDNLDILQTALTIVYNTFHEENVTSAELYRDNHSWSVVCGSIWVLVPVISSQRVFFEAAFRGGAIASRVNNQATIVAPLFHLGDLEEMPIPVDPTLLTGSSITTTDDPLIAAALAAQAEADDAHLRFIIILAIALGVIAAIVITVIVLWLARTRRFTTHLKSTVIGRRCLEASGSSTRAAKLLFDTDYLQQKFRDMPWYAIWFALLGGARSRLQATRLLELAWDLFSLETDCGLIEALERAEWAVDADRFDTLAQIISTEAPRRAEYVDAVVAAGRRHQKRSSSGEQQGPSYLHMVVSTRWRDGANQAAVVAEFARAFPADALDRRVRPRPSLSSMPALNALQLALDRRCVPDVLAVLLQSCPKLAEDCNAEDFAYVREVPHLSCKVLQRGLRIRLLARIKRRLWLNELVGTQNAPLAVRTIGGASDAEEAPQSTFRETRQWQRCRAPSVANATCTAWFTPAMVKLREIQYLLTKVAERRFAAVHDRHLEQPTPSDVANSGASAATVHVPVAESYQLVGFEDSDNTVVMTSSSRPKPSTNLAQVVPVSTPRRNVAESRPRPLTAIKVDPPEEGKLTQKLEPHISEPVSAVVFDRIQAQYVMDDDPWTFSFRRFFLRPVLVVVCDFLEEELKAARLLQRHLEALIPVLGRVMAEMYTVAFRSFILNDVALSSFNAEAGELATAAREAQKEKICMADPAASVQQNKHDIVDLYLACGRTLPLFAFFIRSIKNRCNAIADLSGVAPMKPICRTMEKAALRVDGGQWSCSCALDVVRGCLVFATMGDMLRCLREIQAYPGVRVVRVKNRFDTPTSYAWRDCVVNVVFAADPDRIICEVQLLHQAMLDAQNNLPSPSDVVAYRSASELVLFLQGSSQSGEGSDSREDAAVKKRSESENLLSRDQVQELLRQQRDVLVGQHEKELVELHASMQRSEPWEFSPSHKQSGGVDRPVSSQLPAVSTSLAGSTKNSPRRGAAIGQGAASTEHKMADLKRDDDMHHANSLGGRSPQAAPIVQHVGPQRRSPRRLKHQPDPPPGPPPGWNKTPWSAPSVSVDREASFSV